MSIKDFIENASLKSRSLLNLKASGDAPPQNLTQVFENEDATLAALKGHIENEKLEVTQKIDELVGLFADLCFKTKEEAHSRLDAQYVLLKCNFEVYKQKINKFYQTNNSDDDFASKINRATSSADLHSAITVIKSSLLETKLFTGEQNTQIEQLDNYLKHLSIELKRQCELKPQLKLTTSENKLPSIDTVTKPLESYIKEAFELCNEVGPLPVGFIGGPMDSKIIDGPQSAMLQSWFGRYVSLKLLLRGSTDGWTKQIFNQKCGSYKHTVCLIKETNGKIFGGYSDQTFGEDKGKPTKDAFLFSISNKEMYPNKPENNGQTPLGSTSGYLFLFGWGQNDLAVYENCNTNTSSYSGTFGHYYDNKGRTKTEFVGSEYSFKVSELEVYEVKFSA
jgi:hypothetical protein